jgi:hypothetical protein
VAVDTPQADVPVCADGCQLRVDVVLLIGISEVLGSMRFVLSLVKG